MAEAMRAGLEMTRSFFIYLLTFFHDVSSLQTVPPCMTPALTYMSLTLHNPCPDIHVTGSSESTPMVSLTQDLRPLSLVMGSCWSVLPQLTPQQPWV